MAKASVEHGQKRRLGDLKPHPRNSRIHSPEQVEQIVAAMGEWDWTNPILVDEDNIILAGHGRQLAGIKKYGPDFEAPVSVATGWTEKKKRAYIIADNRLTEQGEWNQPILQAELRELTGPKGMELKPMGFTTLQLDGILTPPAPPAPKSSRVPNAILQYNLVFDDAEQQKRWFDFLRKLKATYPDGTIGAKLSKYLDEQLNG